MEGFMLSLLDRHCSLRRRHGVANEKDGEEGGGGKRNANP